MDRFLQIKQGGHQQDISNPYIHGIDQSRTSHRSITNFIEENSYVQKQAFVPLGNADRYDL